MSLSNLPLPVTRRRLARRSKSAKGTPLARTIGLHKDAAVFECQIVGLALLERRSRRRRRDGQQRCDRVVGRRRRRPGSPNRSPSSRPRAGLPEATYRQAPLRPCRAGRRSSAARAARGSCTCRCRCPAWRRRRGPMPSSRSWTLASAANRAAIQAHPAIPQPSVRPSRFIEPTSGVRWDQPNFSAPSSKHSSKWREENGMPKRLVDFRLVENAELDRVDLELIGQFVHRRLGRVEPGHGAGSAHVGCCADVALGAAERHAQVGHAVMERRGLAAVFVVVVEHRQVVDVVVLQRDELAVGRGAEAHALLRAGAMTDRLEHHLAADHELDRLAELPRRSRGERSNASRETACRRNPSRGIS